MDVGGDRSARDRLPNCVECGLNELDATQLPASPPAASGATEGFFAAWFSRQVVINALRVSLLVGTCLNLINQGGALWSGEGVEWGKFALNFVVPYLVASYSAAKIKATKAV